MHVSRKYTSEEVLTRLKVVSEQDAIFGDDSLSLIDVGNVGDAYLPMYYIEEGGIVSHEYLGVSFGVNKDGAFILFKSNDALIRFNRGDRVSFGLGSFVINFPFVNVIRGELSYARFMIDERDLEAFSSYHLLAWSYVRSDGFRIEGDNSMICAISDIPDTKTHNKLLMEMARLIRNVYLLG